jgi:hypothetical protein
MDRSAPAWVWDRSFLAAPPAPPPLARPSEPPPPECRRFFWSCTPPAAALSGWSITFSVSRVMFGIEFDSTIASPSSSIS